MAKAWTAAYADLIAASRAARDAIAANPDVRPDLAYAIGNVSEATSNELTRIAPEGQPHAPGVNGTKHAFG